MYWLILKNTIFVWKKNLNYYFYDSENFIGKMFLVTDNNVEKIFSSLLDIENLYSIEIEETQLQNENVANIINTLKELGMAKILSKEFLPYRPIQIPPILNLLSDIEKHDSTSIVDKNIMSHLQTINLYLDNKLDKNYIIHLNKWIENFFKYKLHLLVIYNYPLHFKYADIFWEKINSLSTTIKIILNLDKNTIPIINKIKEKTHHHIIIESEITPLLEEQSIFIKDALEYDHSIKFIFNVYSEKDVVWAENIIKTHFINYYTIKPLYNGNNIDFFKKNVFMTESDILKSNQTKQNIFAHQVLNTLDFGNLTVLPNGKIYANIHFPSLGNINDDIRDIVHKEMKNGTSWRRIRNMKPCADCVFQWLCPSPSNYELQIGIPNLCYIQKQNNV